MSHEHDDDDLDGGLPPHLQRLLHDGAEGPPLPTATSERLLGRVLVTVGAAAATAATVAAAGGASGTGTAATTAATATTTATAATAATTAGIGLGLKAAIAAAVVGVAGVIGVVVSPPSRPLPAVEVPVVAPAAPSSPGAVEPGAVEPGAVEPGAVATGAVAGGAVAGAVEPGAVAPGAVSPVATASSSSPAVVVKGPVKAPVSSTPTGKSSFEPPAAWELPVLEQARGALSAGRAEEALALVEDHQRRAPASALLEESMAVRVMALARAGRIEEAKEAAAAFLQRWPESLFGARVRQVVR